MNPMITVWLLFAGLLLTAVLVGVFVAEYCFGVEVDDRIYVGIIAAVFILMLCTFGTIIFFTANNVHVEVVAK